VKELVNASLGLEQKLNPKLGKESANIPAFAAAKLFLQIGIKSSFLQLFLLLQRLQNVK
jgi:hypothetical protein